MLLMTEQNVRLGEHMVACTLSSLGQAQLVVLSDSRVCERQQAFLLAG